MGCCTVVSPKHLTSFWLSFNNFDILLARKCKTHCIEIVKKIMRKTSVISDLKASNIAAAVIKHFIYTNLKNNKTLYTYTLFSSFI